MSIEFTNNASGTLSAQLDGATPGPEDLTLVLQANEGQLFPPVTTVSGNFFYASVEDTSGNIEIVKCTDVSTDTLTITRAQENTTSQTFAVGSKVELRTTAATFAEFIQRTGGVMTGNLDLDGNQLIDPVITSTGSAVIQNVPMRGADNGTANQLQVPSGGADPTIGVNTILHTGNDDSYVQDTRTLTAGNLITGGGDLSANRTFDFDMSGETTMDASEFANDDDLLIYDTSAGAHKIVALEDAGTRIVAVVATRNLAITDSNAFLYCDGTDRTLTIPDSVFHVGTEIALGCPGAGQFTLVAGTNQTINSFSSFLSVRVGGGAYLVQYAADTWHLIGDLE